MDIFGVYHIIGLYLIGSFLCILGSFHSVKVHNGGYFWRLLRFQIFFGVLEILDFLDEP